MSVRGASILALSLIISAGACQRAGSRGSGKPMVAVTVPPQAYLVERLAGAAVDVEIMMPPGTNPHTYEPTIRQVRALGEAKAYVEVGHPKFPFERTWIARLLKENENVQVVDCSQGVQIDADDPHLWLSPSAVRTAVPHIAATLAALLPAAAQEIDERKAALVGEIDALDAEIRAAFRATDKRRFYVFHPAWGYFARQYGLEQVAIENEGKEPDPHRLSRVVEQARGDGVRVIFVQPQLSRRSAEVVANDIGARLVVLDPLARDWLANLRHASREILAGLV
jgi:zinc transport system substrate-binding protein